MTRKSLSIFCAVILILTIGVFVFLANLSSIAIYVIGKMTGGEITVGKIDYTYDRGSVILKLSDLAIKGKLRGVVRSLDIRASLTRRPFLKSTVMSDFDLAFDDFKGKTRFFPVPAEVLSIERGTVTYDGQRIFIDKLIIKGLQSDRPFHFDLTAKGDSFFKTITVSGEGLYRGKASQFKGDMHVAGIDMGHLSKQLKGLATLRGPFTFTKQSLSFEGPFEIMNFELKDRVLSKPISIRRYTGQAKVTQSGDTVDVQIDNVAFLNTSFLLNVKFDTNRLISLDLSSGFMDLKDVKSFMAFDHVAKESKKLWEAIREGRIRITKLHHDGNQPIKADLELKDAGFVYKDMIFTSIQGLVSVDGRKVTISNGRGVFKSSRLNDVKGFVFLARGGQVKVSGTYVVNVQDIPHMLDVGKVRFKRGTTRGIIELEGDKDRGYRLSGKGTLDKADVSWQHLSASARGSYRFTDEEITFDPLIIRKAGTDMVIRGTWSKKYLRIFLKGSLDMDHFRQFATIPPSVEGIINVDLELMGDDGERTVKGELSMDQLAFVIPRFMKKDRGIPSQARIEASVKDGQVRVHHLSYDLDTIKIAGKATLRGRNAKDVEVKLNIHEVARLAPMFFLHDGQAEGSIDIHLAARELTWPVRKIPPLIGYAKVRNGFVKLPSFETPLREIYLDAEFAGESSQIDAKRIVWGRSTLNNGSLLVEGFDDPKFSLSLAFDSLDLTGMSEPPEFRIPSLSKDGLLAKTTGRFSLKASTFSFPATSGKNLTLNGSLQGRKFTMDPITADVLGGRAEGKGTLDLSQTVPVLGFQGKITSMTGGHFLKALGAQTSLIEGEGAITGQITARGEKRSDLTKSLQGNLSIYSRNGTIRRWNLLAKIFHVLNLYDLFRGKIQFTEQGLTYQKMGATFVVHEGVFFTNNFLIDSPSMLISGSGNIDATNGQIAGDINVSPFVTLDRTIDKIPVIRRVLRSRDRGFLFASYHVTGNVEDPVIETNYVSTVGGRVVETLKNILTLPQDLFNRRQ